MLKLPKTKTKKLVRRKKYKVEEHKKWGRCVGGAEEVLSEEDAREELR